MQPQRPPFWEWPLDRFNVLLITGALVALLLLSGVNYGIQRRAAYFALPTPAPAVMKTVSPTAQAARPQTTAEVSTRLTPAESAPTTPLRIVTPRHGSQMAAPLARIEGTAPPGAVVVVFDNNRRLGDIAADAQGQWALDLSAPLTEGDHLLRVQATDAQRQPLGRSAPVLVTILAPQPPTIIAPMAGARLTAGAALTISGSAMPDSLIRVLVDQQAVGETSSNGRGTWQLTLPKPLGRGQHRLRADLISPNGNLLISSAEATVTVAP
jgi:hypothetical protein